MIMMISLGSRQISLIMLNSDGFFRLAASQLFMIMTISLGSKPSSFVKLNFVGFCRLAQASSS